MGSRAPFAGVQGRRIWPSAKSPSSFGSRPGAYTVTVFDVSG